jgi:hypothetical protein
MKKLLFLFIFLITICELFPQSNQNSTELKGVITYFFNKYQGDKPDIGAQIEIWPYVDKTDSLIDKFIEAKTYQILYKSASYEDKSNFMDHLVKLNCETKTKFDSLDMKVAIKTLLLKKNKDLITLNADGSGNYSVYLMPGVYEILITSKGRTGLSVTEAMGKIAHAFITIKPNNQAFFSHKFDLY